MGASPLVLYRLPAFISCRPTAAFSVVGGGGMGRMVASSSVSSPQSQIFHRAEDARPVFSSGPEMDVRSNQSHFPCAFLMVASGAGSSSPFRRLITAEDRMCPYQKHQGAPPPRAHWSAAFYQVKKTFVTIGTPALHTATCNSPSPLLPHQKEEKKLNTVPVSPEPKAPPS